MKSKSEPAAGRSGAKAAGKGKVKRLTLNKDMLKDLSAGAKTKAVKGGKATIRNCY